MTIETGDGRRMLGDRYEIGEVIGRGGMAEVHQGRDLRLGRRVAVKILRPDLARDPSFQSRFRREAQSAAALNHPNIVAVYDTGEDVLAAEGAEPIVVPYIVMEYVDGMTLRQLLGAGRRLLPERALEIAAGVLSALDYAHKHGIVHRDIKPANVMLTRTGDVKVMDFGIARALGDTSGTMTSTSAVMGTAQYLSPEQARGETVDARSDLYSAGVLLYELLTGRPPFTGDSPVSIAYQHVSEMPTPPSQIDQGVPPDVDAVVLTALAKRASDRYQTAAEFRFDVERAISGGPLTAAVPAILSEHTTQMPAVAAAGFDYEYDDRDTASRRPRRAGFWIVSSIAVVLAIVSAILIGKVRRGGSSLANIAVPDLSGLTVQQAQSQLSADKLQLGAQTPQTSDRPTGTVVAQQPAAGEMLAQNQAVNITVSSGKAQSTVPQLVSLMSSSAAQIALQDANLQLGTVTTDVSDQPAGYVIAQDPVPGTQVNAGTLVNITVSSGQISVPDVSGLSEAQARSDLAQAGFDVQVVQQSDNSNAPGTVLAQSPKGGTQAGRGSTVTITVAEASAPSSAPLSGGDGAPNPG